MRVAIAGMFHETNSFASGVTVWKDFEAYQLADGEEILGYRETRSELGGFIAGAESKGWDLKPVFYAAAVPSGLVEHETYERIADRIVDGLVGDGQLDGVLLTLHGAMMTTRDQDPDGDLVRRISAAVGPGVPIMITLDFHANVSDLMVNGGDAMVAYRTYPHVDMFDRALEAVGLLQDALVTGKRRSNVHKKIPLLSPPQTQWTDSEPMKTILSRVSELESMTGARISLTPGFPYADTDCCGMSVVASGHDTVLLHWAVEQVESVVMDCRDQFVFNPVPVGDAVREAASSTDCPVILVDSADNIGGGAPGDGTSILAEWLDQNYKGLVVTLADPESARTAIAAGVGASVHVRLGGKVDEMHGRPIDAQAYVRAVTDGVYTHSGSYNRGYVVHMGKTAVLDVDGNTVVVSERKAMPFDPQQLLSQGVDARQHQAVVVKSAIAWRAALGDIAGQVIEVDSPGICTGSLLRLPYSAARRAMLVTGA